MKIVFSLDRELEELSL